ncbi:acyl-CoA carboxylase subunit beta [Corynebacterium caspium]|uniref:acyl-CoA carboxylase subunit beta n=1 Tax=Corynebacterium caspium TaxID=234828 RepID=UPI00036CB384|nr:carboxyl transferase domain-containing protein [Corynebacterium caspium]WKD59738.1 putative propionyl-CoA carboxylase beta chain 5 [Corynebacterium caspium DSM 44850]
MSDLSTTAGKLAFLQSRLAEAQQPLGTASATRALVTQLVDEGSFIEVDALAKHRVSDIDPKPATDGIIAGYGTIDGRKICVFAQDPSIFEGRLGEVSGEKILKMQQLALKTGVPLVGIYAGLGARASEGVGALAFYTAIQAGFAQASGVIPQLAIIAGELEGPNALLPQCADFLIGPSNHAHLQVESAAAGVQAARKLLHYLPANNRAEAPRPVQDRLAGAADTWIREADKALDAAIPDDPTSALPVQKILDTLVDENSWLELQPGTGAGMLAGLARIEGRVVGVLANTGLLTASGMRKAARLVRTCDAFSIPMLSLVDAPDFDTSAAATVQAAGQLAFAMAEASVGKLAVVLRHAMGAGYTVMGAKNLGTDLVFAWPTAEIAAMTGAQAVPSINAAQLAKAERRGKDVAALRTQLEQDYDATQLTPYAAAERGLVDAVIMPAQTRGQLVEGLRLVDRKVIYGPAKKLGNIQL